MHYNIKKNAPPDLSPDHGNVQVAVEMCWLQQQAAQ
jgi:hypothetical protein